MRLTVRRDLLELPREALERRSDAAFRRMHAACKRLQELPADADIGAFVDLFEAYNLAQREFAQVHTALAIERARP